MSSPSDAEVIGRSLGEPEAFGLIYDRHAAALLRFLGRRVGAKVAEGLVERAFGFREVATSRMVSADGRILHSYVEVGNSMIGIGSQGAHGAVSPKTAGSASQYISVYIDDIDAHYERALAAGARIDRGPHDDAREYRVYEALDLEGHRWRFLQWLHEVPQR